MSHKFHKAIRKAVKKAGKEYINGLCHYKLIEKLRFCKFILTHKELR